VSEPPSVGFSAPCDLMSLRNRVLSTAIASDRVAHLQRWRKVAAAGGLAVAAVTVSQRVKPLPCPYALRWTTDIPRPYLTRRKVVEVLQPQPGEQALEVGPGPGYHTFAVAERLAPGGELHVFDIQQKMLDALMRRAAKRGVENVAPRQGDARQLPYADDSFRAALLITVLGEIPDQEVALRELHRVISPGGRLVVGEIPAFDPHFVRFPVLRRRAEEAGFRLEHREGPGLAFIARFRCN
jgi:SAM-dependent methyltransferase